MGFGVWGLGFRVEVEDFGFRAQGRVYLGVVTWSLFMGPSKGTPYYIPSTDEGPMHQNP